MLLSSLGRQAFSRPVRRAARAGAPLIPVRPAATPHAPNHPPGKQTVRRTSSMSDTTPPGPTAHDGRMHQHHQAAGAATAGESPSTRQLVAFDFDHTVTDDNSDTWIIRCLPGGVLPPDLKRSYVKGRWTEYMQRVIAYMHDEGITHQDLRRVIEKLPMVGGIGELLEELRGRKQSGGKLMSPCMWVRRAQVLEVCGFVLVDCTICLHGCGQLCIVCLFISDLLKESLVSACRQLYPNLSVLR